MIRRWFTQKSQHRLQNPYFNREHKRHFWRLYAALICFVILLGTGGYFGLKTDRWSMKAVRVQGATRSELMAKIQQLVDVYLHEPRLKLSTAAHPLFFNMEDLRRAITSSVSLEKLDLWKEGDTVVVDVMEKNPQLIWNTKDKWYVVDIHGVVLEELQDPLAKADAHLPACVDETKQPTHVGASVLSEQELSGILSFHKALREQSIDFAETHIDRQLGNWASVKTTTGFSIYFDPKESLDVQARNIRAVLANTQVVPERLTYIDVRFGDHVYYK